MATAGESTERATATWPFPTKTFYEPIFPEAQDQGDPYILTLPEGADATFRHYIYTSGIDLATGRAFPVYGSHDLTTLERVGSALRAEVIGGHWAPCVRYIPSLENPYVMLYSHGQGCGEDEHIGHQIRRAHGKSPDDLVDSGHILTPDVDFAIDADVYRSPDGRLMIAYAIDFTEDLPYGTGVVEAEINEDLTEILSPPRLLNRANYPWQIYDPKRKLPWKTILGVDWNTDTVEWHTIEAPVGGLVSPEGRETILYSGGCFFGFYAVGALLRNDDGTMQDTARDDDHYVVRPQPEIGLYAPGHPSLLHHGGETYLLMHVRHGSPKADRQMAIAPLLWSDEGLPYCPPPSS